MEDTINVYDVILVKKVDPSKLMKDDIITFYSTNPFFGSTPITHRIVEVIEDNISTNKLNLVKLYHTSFNKSII